MRDHELRMPVHSVEESASIYSEMQPGSIAVFSGVRPVSGLELWSVTVGGASAAVLGAELCGPSVLVPRSAAAHSPQHDVFLDGSVVILSGGVVPIR